MESLKTLLYSMLKPPEPNPAQHTTMLPRVHPQITHSTLPERDTSEEDIIRGTLGFVVFFVFFSFSKAIRPMNVGQRLRNTIAQHGCKAELKIQERK